MSTMYVPPEFPWNHPSPPAPDKKPHQRRRVIAIGLASLAVVTLIAVAFNLGGTKAERNAAENPVVTTISTTETSRITEPTPAPVTVTAAALPAVTVTAPAPAPITVTGRAPRAVTVTMEAPPAVTVTMEAPPAVTVTVAAAGGSGSSGSGDLSDVLACEADSMALSDAGNYTGAMNKLAECARMAGE